MDDGERKEEEDGGRNGGGFLARNWLSDDCIQILGRISEIIFSFRYGRFVLQVGGGFQDGQVFAFQLAAGGQKCLFISYRRSSSPWPPEGFVAWTSPEKARNSTTHPQRLLRHVDRLCSIAGGLVACCCLLTEAGIFFLDGGLSGVERLRGASVSNGR
jgi:hypothetical protein